MNPITLFTIGFTGKSAEEFFETLRKAGVRRLVDVRLNNVSQLAGFTKKRDLQYFLRSIAGIAYVHEPSLAPTKDILDAYKKKRIDWSEYESQFKQLLRVAPPARTVDAQRLRPRLPALQRADARALSSPTGRGISSGSNGKT